MGILDFLRRPPASASVSASAAGPTVEAQTILDWGDPRVGDLLRGQPSLAGEFVNFNSAMLNTAVFRCVSLLSTTIGMLPLHLIDARTKEKAVSHPLYALLHREPNSFQTAYDFKMLMQMRAVTKGNAYALVVRSRGNIVALVPLDPDLVTPVQNADWTVSYKYQRQTGPLQTFASGDILHLRALSTDGISGLSLVYQARNAIGLSLAADRAISRVYKQGSFVDGTLQTDATLSDTAKNWLSESWQQRFGGADNAAKTPVLEQGLKYVLTGSTARDAQTNETRARQVEEVARIFGVPRPLLMIDDTSWGSGIDSLGQLFVQYGLNPWFEAWQQGIERTLLTGPDKTDYIAKFNAGDLLRGSMEVQGAFFSAALGLGGHAPWMTPNEVRDAFDMPAHPDGDSLKNPAMAQQNDTPKKEPNDASA